MSMTIDEFLSLLGRPASLPPERTATLRQALLADRPQLHSTEAATVSNGTSPVSCRSSTAGLIIGQCQLTDKVAENATGATFCGRHCRDGRQMTVRVLYPPPSQTATPSVNGTAGHCEELLSAWKALQHPNAIPVEDVQNLDGFLCLMRNTVAGDDLASVVRDNGPLPSDAAVDCVLQVAEGLLRAHQCGYAHGRLDAHQLLVDDEGVVWLQPDHPFQSLQPATEQADVEAVRSLLNFLLTGDPTKACAEMPLCTDPLWQSQPTMSAVVTAAARAAGRTPATPLLSEPAPTPVAAPVEPKRRPVVAVAIAVILVIAAVVAAVLFSG